MSALQKILVPVDFSEESANDLRYAVSLAQETQGCDEHTSMAVAD